MESLFNALKGHMDKGEVSRTGAPAADVDGGDSRRVARILYREDRRKNRGRDGGTLVHASAPGNYPLCPRMYVLLKMMKDDGHEFVEDLFGSMRLTWAYGRAAESHVRQTLLRDPEMFQDAYGIWACKCGHTKTKGHYQDVAACSKCGRKPKEYREIALFDSEYGLVGNPDFMFLDGPRYRVVEIKSNKAGSDTGQYPGFRSLTQAFQGHIEQGTHYVKLGQRNGLAMHRRPLVLYVSKGHEPREWYKPFIPEDGPMERAERAVEQQRRVVRAYKGALEEGTLPDLLPACEGDKEKHMKKCPAWAECMTRVA